MCSRDYRIYIYTCAPDVDAAPPAQLLPTSRNLSAALSIDNNQMEQFVESSYVDSSYADGVSGEQPEEFSYFERYSETKAEDEVDSEESGSICV
jgi:hypothetical protein